MSPRARSRGGKFDSCRRTIMLWGKRINLTVGDGDRPELPVIRIRVKQLAGNGVRRCCQGAGAGGRGRERERNRSCCVLPRREHWSLVFG